MSSTRMTSCPARSMSTSPCDPDPRAVLAGVVGDGHELHPDGKGDLSHQVGHEADHSTLNAEEYRLAAFVVFGDLSTELLHPLPYLLRRQQNPVDPADLSLRQRPEPVLGQQAMVVPAIQELDVDLGMDLPHMPYLAVLRGDQALLHRGQLDVQVQVGQEEVGSEHLDDLVAIPDQREGARFVLPAESVEVEDLSKLLLAGVGERGRWQGTLLDPFSRR